MSIRGARLLLALAFAVLTSGAPGVVRAALDEDCCEQGCERPDEKQPCPPGCSGPCAKVATPLPVTPARCFAREPEARSVASTGSTAPVLPLVLSGVFHPPRS